MTNIQPPSLTIVIPALNEEDAIGCTLERTVAAIPEIQRRGRIGTISIVAVSDGSTDNTIEIMQTASRKYPDIVRVIVFEKNRGYGAAISEGFRVGGGEFLSFLDADGTCDPIFFGDLCAAIQDQRADISLGNRMGKESEMPKIRRLGNRGFAALLGFLSGQSVSDTASGMRVIRRETLDLVRPLPVGLDYTPAMSARAIVQGLRIVEVPMSYSERVGESKLHVVRDGFRFLRAIIDAVLVYSPSRPFLIAFMALASSLLLLSMTPIEFYFRNARLEEWMIYRFLMASLLGTVCCLLLNAALISAELTSLSEREPRKTFWFSSVRNALSSRNLAGFAAIAFVVSLTLIAGGFREFLTSGHITTHWSRVIVSAFFLLVSIQCLITIAMRRSIQLWSHYVKNSR